MPTHFTIVRQSNTNLELISKQTEAQEWIQNVLQTQFPYEDFGRSVEDGILLCRLITAIKPGCIKKINLANQIKFKMFENISNFIAACKGMGIADRLLFTETDLIERRNMMKVVNCIHYIADIAAKNGFVPAMEKLIPDDWTFKNTQSNANNKVSIRDIETTNAINDPSMKNKKKSVRISPLQMELDDNDSLVEEELKKAEEKRNEELRLREVERKKQDELRAKPEPTTHQKKDNKSRD